MNPTPHTGVLRDHLSEVTARYTAGESAAKLAREFATTTHTVLKWLRRDGVIIRGVLESHQLLRLPLDEAAFSPTRFEMDPNVAYWIGFLLADGGYYNDNGRWVLSLHLSENDRAHVEKFRSFIGSAATITHADSAVSIIRTTGQIVHTGCSAGISVRSERLISDLIEWGVTPDKSSRVVINPRLSENRDFWRGVVDGDGCLGRRTTGVCAGSPWIALCGNPATVTAFRDFVYAIASYSGTGPRRRAGIWIRGTIAETTVTGRKAAQVIRHLYSGTPTALARKAALAAGILRWDVDEMNQIDVSGLAGHCAQSHGL